MSARRRVLGATAQAHSGTMADATTPLYAVMKIGILSSELSTRAGLPVLVALLGLGRSG